MATIQLPVKVLDEHCATCQCMSLQKEDLYVNMDTMVTQYFCENLHMCTFIRNRIVRNEEKKDLKEEKTNEEVI